MKNSTVAIVLVVIILASFYGGFALSKYQENSNSGTNSTTGTNLNNHAFYITVIDDENNIVKIKQPVNRIVSLAPSCTEIAFSIGLGPRIVGDTIYDEFPPQAVNITKIGGVTNVSVEKVIELNPNLVLAYGGLSNPNTITQIEQAGIPVIIMNPSNLLDILHDVMILGYATNTTANATKVVNTIENFMTDLYNATSSIVNRSTVFYLGWYPDMWTAGEDTFINDMIVEAGGINIASAGYSWFIMNPETLVEENPQWILVSQDQYSMLQEFENNSAFQNITAVRLHHFIILDDYYIEEPGPQMFVGVEILFQTMYPNLANEIPKITLQELFPGNV
ncbi:MAG: ABC transporter substrate-binding protein [Thermoplasmata archaeon]